MSTPSQNLWGIVHSSKLVDLINDETYKESLKQIFNEIANNKMLLFAKFAVLLENIVTTDNAVIFNLRIKDTITDKYIFDTKDLLHITIHNYNPTFSNQSHIRVKTGQMFDLYFNIDKEEQINVYSVESDVIRFLNSTISDKSIILPSGTLYGIFTTGIQKGLLKILQKIDDDIFISDGSRLVFKIEEVDLKREASTKIWKPVEYPPTHAQAYSAYSQAYPQAYSPYSVYSGYAYSAYPDRYYQKYLKYKQKYLKLKEKLKKNKN